MKNGPYTLIIAPPDYPGKKYRGRYCYEHRFVWWQQKKSIIPRGYEIHHKNGNHKDNRITNLEILTSSEHQKRHGHTRSISAQEDVKCTGCKKIFKIKGSVKRTRIKNNVSGIFCCRECLYKWQGMREKRIIKLKCAFCEKEFERRSNRLTQSEKNNWKLSFCSQSHGGLYRSKQNKILWSNSIR